MPINIHSEDTLSLSALYQVLENPINYILSPEDERYVFQSRDLIDHKIQQGEKLYGINTGFGKLASEMIPSSQLKDLQERLVYSHAVGVGELLDDDVVRLIMVLKVHSLVSGHSGASFPLIQAMIALLESEIYPCIPQQGSVGASGDLAPLAHIGLVLIGEGWARYQGKMIDGASALQIAGLEKVKLEAKDGLALLNGTQVSTAIAISHYQQLEQTLMAFVVSGALTTEAIRAHLSPFDERIQVVRGHEGQRVVAKWYQYLLRNSRACSLKNKPRCQDPYSVRCQPQVMGASLDTFEYVANLLETEANAITDNPLVFPEEGLVLSGGNFHAQPVALGCDFLAIAASEMAALSERRIALLMDPHLSNLPAFLIENAGINSGFMIAQVTAASLVTENKHLANPVSTDSLPTSGNQEDHVSMATYAARRLGGIAENCATIAAIELIAACQGLDLLNIPPAENLKEYYQSVRNIISYLPNDASMYEEIHHIKALILNNVFELPDMSEA